MDGSRGHEQAGRAVWARAVVVPAAAAAVAATLALPALAGAHGAVPQRMGERALQAFETRLLGAEHAAEHAAVRAGARRAARRRRTHPRKAGRLRGAPATRGSGRERRRLTAAGPPDVVGAWDGSPRTITRNGRANESLPAIHAILLPTGKVLMFGPPLGPSTPREPRVNESAAVLLDPVSRTFEDVPPPVDPRTGKRSNIYCASASLMSDGRVLVMGGYLDYNQTRPNNTKGLNHTWTFDPWTKAWLRHENLGGGNDPRDITGGRWYPSQMLMPDGRTVVVMGTTEAGNASNWTVEVYDPAKPLGSEVDMLSGTIPRFGEGTDVVLYPKTFWMPSGRGYVVGPSHLNSWFMALPSPLNLSRTDAGDPQRERTYGTGVLRPLAFDSAWGSVMRIGGSSHPNNDGDDDNDIPDTPGSNYRRLDAVASTEVFDEAANRWTAGPSLNQRRGHHNTVLLPNSTMVTVGGGVGGDDQWEVTSNRAERQVELFDGSRWILGPAGAESRAYHSTALLLPDGSVLSAGDDNPDATDVSPQLDTYEIYKPPYFFKGARPSIAAAPAATGYGTTFAVRTPNSDIARAVLAAPGAATHATDMSQRVVTLPVTRRSDGTGYDVRTPVNRNIALPGHYMLFLVDTQGRPSVARWIALATPAGPGGGTDTTAPVVSGRSPEAGASGVPVGSNVSATFSEAVQGVSDLTFTLRSASGADVPAAVTQAAGAEWILDPSIALAPSTTYTVTLAGGTTGGIRDLANNALVTTSWSFRTASSGDAVAPSVTSPRFPAQDNQTGVAPASRFTLTFSEPVQGVSTTSFTLQRITSGLGTTPVTLDPAAEPATVSYDTATRLATLDPARNLAEDARYRLTWTGGPNAIRDLAGNVLATGFFDLTTGPRPVITARAPGVDATRTSRTADITATFSEPVTGVSASTFSLRRASTGATVPAVVRYSARRRQAVLDPSVRLAARTRYTVTPTTGIKDLGGNAVDPSVGNHTWSFTTGG